jgi:hypothetical protein
MSVNCCSGEDDSNALSLPTLSTVPKRKPNDKMTGKIPKKEKKQQFQRTADTVEVFAPRFIQRIASRWRALAPLVRSTRPVRARPIDGVPPRKNNNYHVTHPSGLGTVRSFSDGKMNVLSCFARTDVSTACAQNERSSVVMHSVHRVPVHKL